MSSVFGSSFVALIAVGVGDTVGVGAGTGATCGTAVGAAGVGATCGTAVGAAGTGVFATGGGTGFDLPPEESSSSPLILKGRLDIRPSTVSPDTASVSAISSSEAPVCRRFVTTIPMSDSDADVLAFATYAFTTLAVTRSLSAMSSVVAPACTRLDTAIDRNLSAGATQSWTGLLEGGFVAMTTGSGVTVGGTGVAVGGTGVAVGGTGVAVGGTGVAVGGTAVSYTHLTLPTKA